MKTVNYLCMVMMLLSGVFSSTQAAVMPFKMLDMQQISVSQPMPQMNMAHTHQSVNSGMTMDSDNNCCDATPPTCCQSDDSCSTTPCYCVAVAAIAIGTMPNLMVPIVPSSILFDAHVTLVSLPSTSLYRPPII